jgi:hypothetical protein
MLEKNQFTVYKPERKEFYMKIKNGQLEYNKIIKLQKQLVNEIEKLYINTNLPEQINKKVFYNFLNKIL